MHIILVTIHSKLSEYNIALFVQKLDFHGKGHQTMTFQSCGVCEVTVMRDLHVYCKVATGAPVYRWLAREKK